MRSRGASLLAVAVVTGELALPDTFRTPRWTPELPSPLMIAESSAVW